VKNFIKNNSILVSLAVIVLLGVVFPNFKMMEVSGGFAWLQFAVDLFFGIALIVSAIFGGEISASSEGLIPLLKRFFKRK
jgi:hypothetical protein